MEEHEVSIWTVYNSPKDYPGEYIARRCIVKCGPNVTILDQVHGPIVTKDIFRSTRLDLVRREMERRYLVRLERQANDDPKIVECWI